MKRNRKNLNKEQFPLHKQVRQLMKEKNITHLKLGKLLKTDRSVISRLLDTPDWLVSEMQAVGAALGTNLFTYYVPAPDTTAQEQLQQTITQLQQQLSERDKQLAEAHIENKILQAKLEVLTGKKE